MTDVKISTEDLVSFCFPKRQSLPPPSASASASASDPICSGEVAPASEMFKLGRGGGAGRGNVKRSLPPSSSLHRPATAPGGRLPIGASAGVGRGRPGRGSAAPSPPSREETFSLESGGGPPDFAAIIRLTPDLVDEIRRVEAQGGVARIKFDPNLNNPEGNVIDVGGKEFRFTWSRELRDLCDIYEEQRSGENGHGLLVESGAAWRKLTVQRILDESTKNHVKMRSEEAERLSKSRKAIVLDPANPSVKNQAKSMAAAAVEGSMRRMNWKQKEFFKNRKVDSNPVSNIGPSRSVFKSVTSSNNSKGRVPVSPLSTPPEQHLPVTSASSFGTGNNSHHHDGIASSNLNKEKIGNFETELPRKVHSDVKPDTSGHDAGHTVDHSMDLRHRLITALSKNPKGMNLKALEKAVGERLSTSSKKFEGIIKDIATFQAPGRYFLKSGMELESINLQAPNSGSSPNTPHDKTLAVEVVHEEKFSNEKIEQQSPDMNLEEELDIIGNPDMVGSAQELFLEHVKADNDSQGRACSSSESGSDSDSESESSGSGSDSGSQSKASSSDSDSDDSSSKEVSDVDVDIISSDNEREMDVHKAVTEDDHEKNEIRIDQEAEVSIPFDLNELNRMDEMTEAVNPSDCSPHRNIELFENPEATENIHISAKGISTSHYDGKQLQKQQMSFGDYSFDNVNDPILKSSNNDRKTIMKDRPHHDLSDNSGKFTKHKTRKTINSENSEGRTGSGKRAKTASSAEAMSLRKLEVANLFDNMQHESPEGSKPNGYNSMPLDDILQGGKNTDNYGRIAATENLGSVSPSPDFASALDVDHPGKEIGELSKKKGSDLKEKLIRATEKIGNRYVEVGRDNMDKNFHSCENLSNLKVKVQKDTRSGVKDTRERNLPKGVTNGQFGKQTSAAEKFISSGTKGPSLRREISDLELGEFREIPGLAEESVEVKRQLDRIGSFKTLDNKASTNDGADLEISKGRGMTNSDFEINKGRAMMNTLSGSKKPSPSPKGAGQGNRVLQRREPTERFSDSAESGKPQPRATILNHELPRLDNSDSEVPYWDVSAETAARNGKRMGHRIDQENFTNASKKIRPSMFSQPDNKNGGLTCHLNGERQQKSSASEQSKRNVLMMNDDRNMRDSSSDDDNSNYSKYDKVEPELKGPIKDFSQYELYVQEFQEKYEVYCYLYKNLEKIRNQFFQIGNDLEFAKEQDRKQYNNLVEKLRDMYHHYCERNKQMKRVFTLLHEELKNLKQRIKIFAKDYGDE
ncbi:dentin sialophosphoprotein-like [Zingiber officinale]|nr:dentin sialophosphoprotein-like [Zingiber officinale]